MQQATTLLKWVILIYFPDRIGNYFTYTLKLDYNCLINLKVIVRFNLPRSLFPLFVSFFLLFHLFCFLILLSFYFLSSSLTSLFRLLCTLLLLSSLLSFFHSFLFYSILFSSPLFSSLLPLFSFFSILFYSIPSFPFILSSIDFSSPFLSSPLLTSPLLSSLDFSSPLLTSPLLSSLSIFFSFQVCFIIFYKSTSIESKIKRICDAFSANRYDLSNLNQTQELDKQQQDNHREMTEVIKPSSILLHSILY